jgi:hypothetical protein
MGLVLDLMEDRFEEISSDCCLMLNEDYVMDMFSSITVKVAPYTEYLEFMCTENQRKTIAGC